MCEVRFVYAHIAGIPVEETILTFAPASPREAVADGRRKT
jgi:hypothetical protein